MRLRLAVLWFAASVAATAWAQDALTREMARRIGEAYPKLDVRVQDEDRLQLSENGKQLLVMDLFNLRAICRARPEDCEREKVKRVQLVAQAREGVADFQLAEVRAVVRTADYAAHIRRQIAQMDQAEPGRKAAPLEDSLPLQLPLGSGLVRMWVKDTPTGMAPLQKRQVEEKKLSPADLDRASTRNFAAEDVPPLRQSPNHPALWFSIGNDYISSILVDETLWKRVAGPMAQRDVVACFPERHALLAYFPHLDPRHEIDPERLCRQATQRSAVAFSDRPVRRINDNWTFER